jgi:hypothetical protein
MVLVYVLLTLALGILAFDNGTIHVGIASIIGSILCCFTASSFRRLLATGTVEQKVGGLAVGIVFVAVGIGLVYNTDAWIGMFGYHFTGVTWCLVGLVTGWVASVELPQK